MSTDHPVSNLIGNSGVGIDIGGSFAKLVYFRPLSPVELPSYVLKEATTLSLKADFHLSINSDQLGGVIRFIRMPVSKVDAFSTFVRDSGVHNLFNFKETLNVTGGGAFKFEKMLKERLNVSINKLDEMKMLVNGLNFVLEHVHNEVFTYSHETKKQEFVAPISEQTENNHNADGESSKYPYLLVNIGSGVSILKVTAKDQFQRVSGSSIGGGTFWGLACQLTDVSTFDQVQEMTNTGDNRNVDLMVGDIYGTGYDKLGLDAGVIASSFGKAGFRHDDHEDMTIQADPTCLANQLNARSPVSKETSNQKDLRDGSTISEDSGGPSQTNKKLFTHFEENPIPSNKSTASPTHSDRTNSPFRATRRFSTSSHTQCSGAQAEQLNAQEDVLDPELQGTYPWNSADMVKSLLFMICNNIGQVSYLNAKLHQVKRVYFAGGFIQRNPYIWSTLSFAIKFWSKGDMQAMFLVHDGYLGALGALVAPNP